MSSSNNSKLFTKRGSKRVKKEIIHNFLLPDDVIQFFQSVARHLSCPYNQDITFFVISSDPIRCLDFFFVCVLSASALFQFYKSGNEL